MASRIHLAAISDRKAFGFREQSPLPVASSGLPRAHLPFGQFLDLGFGIHAGGFSISPPSHGAWPENIRFDKTIVFLNQSVASMLLLSITAQGTLGLRRSTLSHWYPAMQETCDAKAA
jgi:hypothetical protein